MERIVLALGARGLVNAQFIVRDDGVYLIEVNPRAAGPCRSCRRSPACRWSSSRSGSRSARRSPELGWDGGLLAAAAVRRGQGAGLLDRQAARRRPVGRAGMQSTGEVIGIHTDPRVALAKALLGAALVPPRPGDGGERSRCSRSPTATRRRSPRSPRRWRRPATGSRRRPGRARRSQRPGYEARPVAKLGEAGGRGDGEVAILDLIADGRGPAGRQHADAALGRGPRRGRDPARGDRRRGSCA